jgi:hypothetical protein
MADALRATLGARAFTPDVEAAWAAVYGYVTKHMAQGIDQAARAMEAEASLRDVLSGALPPPPPAAAPVLSVAAAVG